MACPNSDALGALPCAAGATAPDVLPLLAGLFGGLALFLYGMDKLSEALRAVAGDRMRQLLARLTRNRIAGAGTGALVTAVIQSSSVTTVLVVGFVSAGLLTLAQAVPVIMGANVGTTVTAQIIAFQVTQAALTMIAVGFAITFLSRRPRVRQYGAALLGLGLVFLGMTLMGDAMKPLRTWSPFTEAMVSLETPLLGILVGAAFTALVQSSSATTGVVIVLASQQLLQLPAGIALILGANIGTCVTAMIAALKKPPDAVRAAVVHVLFNVIGVLLWLPLIGLLAGAVLAISPAGDVPRQIANAHTIFNLVNTLLFLPVCGAFAWAATRIVPDAPPDGRKVVRPKYLDDELLATPALALDRCRMEILHLGNHTKEMLQEILPAMLEGRGTDLDRVAAKDDTVDILHGRIIDYLSRVGRKPLSEAQTADLVRLMEATNSLESIGDVIERSLAPLGRDRIAKGIQISASTRKVLTNFHGEVVKALDGALMAVTQTSVEAARVVTGMKTALNRMAEDAAAHGAGRLVAPEPHRLPSYKLEMDMLEGLKRVYYFAKRMARVVVPGRR